MMNNLKPFDCIRSAKERLELEKGKDQNMEYSTVQIWAKDKQPGKND